MSESLLRGLLGYFKGLRTNNTAPYDWSFGEQERVDELIKAIEAELGNL